MSKISVTTIAGLTSGGDANKVIIESGDTLQVDSNATVGGTLGVTGAFTSQGIDDNADAVALTIDSSERVMIGTTTEGSVGANQLTVADSANTGITIRAGTTSSGSAIYMSDATSGTGEYAGYIAYSHSADSMAIGAAAGQRIRIDSDGLKFGGDSAAANALNDYEEGTFTPVFVNVNAPTYSSQVGRYTKIGNAVHCTVSIDVSTGLDTSDGSTVSIGGLPFTAVSSELATNGFLGRYINLLGSKATSLSNIRQTDSAIMLLQGHDSGIQYNQINSGGFLQIAFTYRSA